LSIGNIWASIHWSQLRQLAALPAQRPYLPLMTNCVLRVGEFLVEFAELVAAGDWSTRKA